MELNPSPHKFKTPTPQTVKRHDCEPDCSFEDIFATPPPIASQGVDSEYIHLKESLFARLFHKKQAPKRAA